jgi:hypothetical protein
MKKFMRQVLVLCGLAAVCYLGHAAATKIVVAISDHYLEAYRQGK